MASISFYRPPPTPTPLPPNRPHALRDVRRSAERVTHESRWTESGQLREAIDQVELQTNLRCLSVLLETDMDHESSAEQHVETQSYKLTMQSGQIYSLALFTADPKSAPPHQCFSQASTFASLLSSLHLLTAPRHCLSSQRGPAVSPLRFHRPIMPVMEGTASSGEGGWAAVLLEDLSTHLIGGSPNRRAGTLSEILTKGELHELRTHLLTSFEDINLPSPVYTTVIDEHGKKTDRVITRVQLVSVNANEQGSGDQSLQASGQRKDSGIAGLGYSPESAFRNMMFDEQSDRTAMRLRSQATPSFERSPERRPEEAKPTKTDAIAAEMLINVDLFCSPSTSGTRINLGCPLLYLKLFPVEVLRSTTIQLLADRL
ncbi:hypothetical protein OC846_002024 [Tilletia horrida]|uniref:Uncharacterized protein n=1 Tax=Tilletia horrida TaxID=155126 RepID=A0AAN6GVE3_9BASI|nr:hypothetical protein OC845_002159 [Tilletia horrida]KAK0554690.1 hypothetical protein OC846_002024 [Tilletia horrida]KAK0569806.1 hypothetical protein OC861_000517 [Tilletia horrida]